MKNFGSVSQAQLKAVGDNLKETGDKISDVDGKLSGVIVEELFAILQNGLDSGAYNLDKDNDFVKEFAISLSDGQIEDYLGSFSTKSQDLFKAWQNGEASSKDDDGRYVSSFSKYFVYCSREVFLNTFYKVFASYYHTILVIIIDYNVITVRYFFYIVTESDSIFYNFHNK